MDLHQIRCAGKIHLAYLDRLEVKKRMLYRAYRTLRANNSLFWWWKANGWVAK